jgi:hypothetical protein
MRRLDDLRGVIDPGYVGQCGLFRSEPEAKLLVALCAHNAMRQKAPDDDPIYTLTEL